MLIIFAVFIIPFYLKQRLFTMPEFLANRFDEKVKNYFSVLSILASIFIDIAGALYAGGILFNMIFPEYSLNFAIALIALISGLYTYAGGLKAVVTTDVIQAVLLTFGACLISFYAYSEVGSWDNIKAAVDESYFSLVKPLQDEYIPWPTIFISLPILGFYFICTNQPMVQRVLGAKNLNNARNGALLAGALKLPLLFILVIPGIIALVLFPSLSNSNEAFPQLMLNILPAGFFGIIFTGFIAALMSSIDSALIASSAILTMDFYKKISKTEDQVKLVKTGRFFIPIIVIFASIWAPYINNFPTLWEYLQAALSYLVPPIVTCFLFGLFWKKATSKGALYSLITGNGLSIILMTLNFIPHYPSIHFLYAATLIFTVSCLTMIITSVLDKESKPALQWTYFFDEHFDRRYLTLSFSNSISILLLLTSIITIVWLFW